MSKDASLAEIDRTIEALAEIADMYRLALGGGKVTQADVDRSESLVRDWRIKRRAAELARV